MAKKVYVNRTLNMKKISHIGLDMDHTLVRYNSRAFEGLTHKIMLEKLVSDKSYPQKILSLEFVWERAIRGLVIDHNQGNILKLSRFGAIRKSYHGLKEISFLNQRNLYKSTYIDLSDPEYDTVDTHFSIAFASLYAQLVDLHDNDPECASIPDYKVIAADLNSVLDKAHRDGSIKSLVEKNLDQFIVRDEEVVHGLLRYIQHNKTIFIVTNSDYEYSKLLLDYAINPFLPEGKTWQDIFTYVITSAQKPRFFYDSLRFLKVDPDTGKMTNLGTEKVTPGVYQGGCARLFTDDLGLEPDEILYVGDHIYGDILRLKKDCAWRTALVVEEIDEELAKLKSSKELSDQVAQLMEKKIPIEIKIDKLISKKVESNNKENQEEIDELIEEIQEIDRQISPLIQKQEEFHNPYWGELMRVGIEESYFAYQVERFACVYMSKLSDMLKTSPRTYFRAPKRLMAHDYHI